MVGLSLGLSQYIIWMHVKEWFWMVMMILGLNHNHADEAGRSVIHQHFNGWQYVHNLSGSLSWELNRHWGDNYSQECFIAGFWVSWGPTVFTWRVNSDMFDPPSTWSCPLIPLNLPNKQVEFDIPEVECTKNALGNQWVIVSCPEDVDPCPCVP